MVQIRLREELMVLILFLIVYQQLVVEELVLVILVFNLVLLVVLVEAEAKEIILLPIMVQEQQIKEIMEVLVLKVPKCLVEEAVVLQLQAQVLPQLVSVVQEEQEL